MRRFEADLRSTGRDLAPERAGHVHDLTGVSIPKGGRTVSWRNGLIGVAAAAVVLLAIAAAAMLGDRSVGSDVGRVFGLGMNRSEAAEAFGIPENAVVLVGGDAVGLRVRETGASATLELLVIAASDRRVRQVYEGRVDIPPRSGGVDFQPVRCFGLLERDVYAIIALGWPIPDRAGVSSAGAGIGGITGEHVVFETPNDRTALLFVAEAEDVAADSSFLMDMGGGMMGSGSLEDEGAVNCAQPATATCGDWSEWADGTRASMTAWLTETRLDAVRTAQHMPANATDAEVVDFAVASIDKSCRGDSDTRLSEIAARLYD